MSMRSYHHELILFALRRNPTLVVDLLRGTGVQLPEFDKIYVEHSANSLGPGSQGDLARLCAAKARADMVIKLLELRFGPVSGATRDCVYCADETQLHTIIERALTAHTCEEALATMH